MKLNLHHHLLGAALGLALLVLGNGCDKKRGPIFIVNQRPEVRLTSAPIDTSGLNYYSVTVNWVGFDPDGRVDHYLYAIDPGRSRCGSCDCDSVSPNGQDTVWVRTEDNEQRLCFKSTERYQEREDTNVLGRDPHTFVIKAIDNKGEAGPYAARSFFSFTVAPSVRITNPIPSQIASLVTPAVRVNWRGEDPDGVFTTKPVKYKYLMLGPASEFPVNLSLEDPDSLRRFYVNHQPTATNPIDGPWAGWDSTSAETTQAQFSNLTPGSQYVFVVIAFDEAGAYSPLFGLSSNMIRLSVGFAGVLGPKLTMFNEYLTYQYPTGGFCVCEKSTIPVEVPSRQLVTVNWFADPPEGADIKSYRWALDIESVFDETPRTNELNDVRHWSSPSEGVKSCTVGPFRGGDVHLLYIEAQDNNGLVSLGILRLDVVEATLEKPLLIVDDTRLRPDNRSVGQPCMDPPGGSWPMRAELDTFLFARGGVPWRCYPTAPDTTRTQPGIFAGYVFDTLGTRVNRSDLTVKLSILGHYQNLIWMTDGLGGQNKKSGLDAIDPMTAIRYMGLPGKVNTIGAYVKQGGRVWLNGGGAGAAVSDGFNDIANDRPPVSQTKTFSSVTSTKNELGPGRFMYEIPKWQSEFRILKPNLVVTKSLGRFTGTSQYAEIPDKLEAKTPTTDPLSRDAPGRASGSFYLTGTDIEFLQLENRVVEDIDPDPDVVDEESVLDTLYRVRAPTLPDAQRDPTLTPLYVIMTYYHAAPPSTSRVVHSGFPIWFFKREQCQQLVDYVLQRLWGLTKNPVPAYGAAPLSARVAAAPPARSPAATRRAVPVGAAKPTYPRD